MGHATFKGLISACLFLGFLLVSSTESAKVLGIVTWPSKSHQILGNVLFKALVARGHNVTVIGSYPLENPPENLYQVELTLMKNLMKKKPPLLTNPHVSNWVKLAGVLGGIHKAIEMVFRDENMNKFLQRQEKFDVCIVTAQFFESMLGICHHVQAVPIVFSTIGMSSYLSYHTRNPIPYSYVANNFMSFSDHMTFMDRFQNMVAWIGLEAAMHFVFVPNARDVLKKYFPNAPPLSELLDNVDLYLANTHFSTDTPKALLPNIIPIGGFHLRETQELTKDIEEFLNNSTEGVIYFNLGGNVRISEWDQDILDKFINTFAKVNMSVLWKFEKDLPHVSKNIKTVEWMPQRAVLAHPNVKVFITHSGLGGTVEAIYNGVPMICFPIFSDQSKNAADSVSGGYGIKLDILKFTEEELLNSILEMTTNPKYKKAVTLKSDIYRNQEIDPLDKAIFWVEHAIRHKGAKHLKSQAAEIPLYQYMLLDVLAFALLIVIVLLMIVYLIYKVLVQLISLIIRFLRGMIHGTNEIQTKKQN